VQPEPTSDEAFELQNFPFDSQPLRLQLRSTSKLALPAFEFVHGALFEEDDEGCRLPEYVTWDREGTVSTSSTPHDDYAAWQCDCAGDDDEPGDTAWRCRTEFKSKMLVGFRNPAPTSDSRVRSIKGERDFGTLGVTVAALVERRSGVHVIRVMVVLAGFAV